MSGAAGLPDEFDEDSDDDWEVALRNEEDEWSSNTPGSYTPSPEKSSLPFSPPPLPSPTAKAKFGATITTTANESNVGSTTTTTASESNVGSTGEAITKPTPRWM